MPLACTTASSPDLASFTSHIPVPLASSSFISIVHLWLVSISPAPFSIYYLSSWACHLNSDLVRIQNSQAVSRRLVQQQEV